MVWGPIERSVDVGNRVYSFPETYQAYFDNIQEYNTVTKPFTGRSGCKTAFKVFSQRGSCGLGPRLPTICPEVVAMVGSAATIAGAEFGRSISIMSVILDFKLDFFYSQRVQVVREWGLRGVRRHKVLSVSSW